MPLAAFSDHFALYDVTAVENLFLLEFMPSAPGDAVRVYLYGLMLCRHAGIGDSIESVAKALNMTAEQVLKAFRYWEQRGLVVGMTDNPPTFQYLNVRSAMLSTPVEDNPAYALGPLNQQLRDLFGDMETAHLRKVAEWVEDLHLPPDVVALMAEKTNAYLVQRNGGKPRSSKYVFKVLDERAMDWASRGIDSVEKAEAELVRERPPFLLARKVLDRFGLRRNPTADEIAMAGAWLNELSLQEEDVLGALKETTKSANPSFAYVDGILRRRHRRAADGQGIDVHAALKQVLEALGARQAPSDALIAEYEGWVLRGFTPDAVHRAAEWCSRKGAHTPEKLFDVLGKWLPLGLTTVNAIEEYQTRRTALRALTLKVFDLSGIRREPTDADLDQTHDWLGLAEPEMIEYAAQCANGLKLPARSITKRISEWRAAGVTTLEEARAFKRPAYKDGAAEPKSAALNYAQRPVDDDRYAHLFADLSRPEKAPGERNEGEGA